MSEGECGGSVGRIEGQKLGLISLARLHIMRHIIIMAFETQRKHAMSARKKAMRKTGEINLAKEIRELRFKLDLAQEQFAAKVGVTFSTVNRWESGKSKPSPLAMRQIEELMERAEEKE